jgi:hypothetical protein
MLELIKAVINFPDKIIILTFEFIKNLNIREKFKSFKNGHQRVKQITPDSPWPRTESATNSPLPTSFNSGYDPQIGGTEIREYAGITGIGHPGGDTGIDRIYWRRGGVTGIARPADGGINQPETGLPSYPFSIEPKPKLNNRYDLLKGKINGLKI